MIQIRTQEDTDVNVFGSGHAASKRKRRIVQGVFTTFSGAGGIFEQRSNWHPSFHPKNVKINKEKRGLTGFVKRVGKFLF